MAVANPTVAITAVASTTAATLATASFSPSANALLLVFASCRSAAAATRLPVSISQTFSPTLTWTPLTPAENINAGSSVTGTAAAWWAITGATPGSGTVTLTWTGNSTRRAVQVFQVATGYSTITPIRQNKPNNGAGSTLTVTYDAALLADSLSLAAAIASGATALTPDGAYAELSDITAGTNHAQEAQFKNGGAATTVAWSAMGSVANAGIAAEVQAIFSAVSVSDSATLGESITLFIPQLFASASDSTAVADTPALLLPQLYAGVSESTTVSDAPAVAVIRAVSVADSATLSDTPALLVPQLYISASDSVAVTDTRTLLLPQLYASVADSTSVAATPALLLPQLYASGTDSAAVTDTPALLLPQLYAGIADSASVADTPTVAVAGGSATAVAVSDSTIVSDTPTLALTIGRAASDSAAVADAPTVAVTLGTVNVSEAVTVGESVALLRTPLLLTVSDAVSVEDTPFIYVLPSALELAMLEAVVVGDTPTIELGTLPLTFEAPVGDAVTMGEFVALVIYILATPPERSYSIAAESRSVSIESENRTLSVRYENRTLRAGS